MPSQNLTQTQKQQLRLNLHQMMLGRLLEMSTPEFEEEIVRQMEENPALTTLENIDDMVSANNLREDDVDDSDSDYDFPVSKKASHSFLFTNRPAFSSEAENIEEQLSDIDLSPLERETVRYIIGNLDSSGYLTRQPDAIADDMASTAGIFVPVDTVEKMIKVVKTLDPAGIGAADLKECLLIQLDRLQKNDIVTIAREIIGKNYKNFINNRPDIVRESIGCDDNALDKAYKLIRALNPKPGASLFDHSDDRTAHISPDFIVETDNDGNTQISLAGSIPELAIAPSFILDPTKPIDPKGAEFIKERHDGARDFIKNVKARGTTLMTIIKAIAALQPVFFRTFEPTDLRPMVIRDIEELTGLDKSAISRATSSKYMLTPNGMFLLKSLFGESVSGNTDISAREVEAKLKKIIDEEDKSHPLSDDEITEAMAKMGLSVARRTVAKYRDRLNIPIARLRRK